MSQCEDNAQKQIDQRFGIMSYEQYLKDLKVKKFNKICMTEVMNADYSIATFGEEKYYKTSSEILAMGTAAYKQMGIDHLIYVYCHSYKSFMAVANDDMSDEDFFNLMKANHEQYQLITAQQTSLGGVSRFVLAFGDNLINRVKSAFYVNKELQNNFIVAGNEKEQLANDAEETAKMFDLLNYAIKNDKVVPFYQGIYNNKTGKIQKYEALMRVFDQDGKIYPPGLYLEAAKKLKLYLTLSKIVIEKSLQAFEDKQSEISLNISLLDIQSPDFQNWFLDRVKQYKDPSKIIVEFLETENYNKNDELFSFLREVRNAGCKIAVDDFGVGFATYTSIISLKPDIIKIDGDIIRGIAKSEDNRLILNSIMHMAKLVNANTTAEFVENTDIQKFVSENDVTYSQGYLFAKPEPFEALNVE